MGKPQIITGVTNRRQETPHTMVLRAIEPMAIASLSLTTIIRLSAPSLHLKATLPLVSGLLIPKVIILRIDALTTSRVTNSTLTIIVRHQTTRGNHKGVAPTPAVRNPARGVLMIMVAMVRNQIGDMPMGMVTIVRNVVLSAIKEDTRAMKGQHMAIRSRENHIRVSRVDQKLSKGGKSVGGHGRRVSISPTENNLKAIMSNLPMILLPRPNLPQKNLSEAIDITIMGSFLCHTRTDMLVRVLGSCSARTPSFVQVSMKMQKN